MNYYESGSIVWVKLSQHWWPGSVKCPDDCPVDYIKELKKDPLAIVKFFNEAGFHHVTRQEQIFSYNCNKKIEFIKKGLNSVKTTDLSTKFEEDIAMAEKLTGGNMDLVKDLKVELSVKKGKKNFYSSLGFGEPKPMKKTKDVNHQRKGFSNIGESILYKPDCSTSSEARVIEHIVKIMEQPIIEPIETSNFFKCYTCDFTCSRLNVIIWHNKNHLKTVVDFDTGIRVPYRKKRKSKVQKNRLKKIKTAKATAAVDDHLQSNGHSSPTKDLHETKQLLLDWDDDDVEDAESKDTNKPVNGLEESVSANGTEGDIDGEEDEENDDNESDSDENEDCDYPPQPKRERQPMPKQVDINSAFDALLAESSPLNAISNNHHSTYVNNDSDSDGSWEKYYEKRSESEDEQESDIKGICDKTSVQTNGVDAPEDLKIESEKVVIDNEASDKKDKLSVDIDSSTLEKILTASSSSSSAQVVKKVNKEKISDDHSSQSPSPNSSNSSGPAYMLVAIDAHGNNVPMPVLSEGANHLVAVEASMEDGTTRTLYIDPAHLGPNVDLNNLMLHIDNSGQETVIIPTSTADKESSSSSSTGDKNSSESTKKSLKGIDDGTVKRKLKETDTSDSKSPKYLDGKVTKLKKASKSSQDKPPGESKEEPSTVGNESYEDLPDLDAEQYEGEILFIPDEIVWSLTHGMWWPSFVVKVYHKEKKLSILFINCQQSTPIKVGISRVKAFNYTDFPEIFENQKDKAVGLTDAMQFAHQYKILCDENAIKETPKEFFSLSLQGQKDIFRKIYFLKRGIPIDDRPIDFMFTGLTSQSEKPSTSTDTEIEPQVNDNSLSVRDKKKLESAQKAHRTDNEKFIRYIRSHACLHYLRQICREEIKSKRHDDFLFFSHQLQYWHDMNKRHNPGMDFFGSEDTKQLDQMYLFLESQFKEQDLGFLSDSNKKGMYVKLVLFPEAIKEALRHLTKLEEKQLESTLVKGLFQTATEKKVKRLEFE